MTLSRVPLLTNDAYVAKKPSMFSLEASGSARTSFAKLDTSKLDAHTVLFFIGKRNSGKTALVRDICYNMHVHKCKGTAVGLPVAFCGTESSQRDIQTFVPASLIYKGFNETVVSDLMEKQQQLVAQKGKENVRTVVLIIDDCAFDKAMWKSDAMRELVFNGRHCNITLIVTVQYLMDVPTWLRTNIDMTFVLLDNIKSNRKKYHEYYFGQFNGLAAFNKAYELLTENYGAMISKNNSNSSNLQETVFWYRSDLTKLPATFQFGHCMFWYMDNLCELKTPTVTSFHEGSNRRSSNQDDTRDEVPECENEPFSSSGRTGTTRSPKRLSVPGHIVM